MKKVIFLIAFLSGCATAENGFPRMVFSSPTQVSYEYNNLAAGFGGVDEKDAAVKASVYCQQYSKKAEPAGIRAIGPMREAIFNCL